ncbi:MAG: TolC family protein [Brevundimonas sp.]|nr:TolC family protein [Brevundimonas sp.]MCA3717231.1 TolC family protein [Brevundimonas sp.]
MPRLAPLLLGALLAGCATTPAVTPPLPTTPPAAWSAGAPPPPGQQMRLDWWAAFQSEELDQLVVEALAANRDVLAAEANLRAARALAGEARTLREPQGGVSTGLQRSREAALSQPPVFGTPDRFENQTLGFLAAELSWELDLAGGLAAATRAAEADAGIALWQRRQIEAAVAAQVVRAWLDLGRANDLDQLADRRRTALEASVALMVRRQAHGAATEAEVAALRRLSAESAAERPTIALTRNNALRRIAVLTGRDPVDFSRATAPLTGRAATPDDLIAPAPADMLRQRPDVQAAELRVIATFERAGVARAALYPSLSLGAAAGRTAAPRDLDQPGALRFSIGPSVSWGLFNLRRIRAGVRAAEAEAEAATAAWGQAILVALEEADGAFDAWRTARASARAMRAAADHARVEADVARARARAGAATPLDLALAEAALLSTELALANADAAERDAWAQAHLALGAGWRPEAGSDSAAPLATGA